MMTRISGTAMMNSTRMDMTGTAAKTHVHHLTTTKKNLKAGISLPAILGLQQNFLPIKNYLWQ